MTPFACLLRQFADFQVNAGEQLVDQRRFADTGLTHKDAGVSPEQCLEWIQSVIQSGGDPQDLVANPFILSEQWRQVGAALGLEQVRLVE